MGAVIALQRRDPIAIATSYMARITPLETDFVSFDSTLPLDTSTMTALSRSRSETSDEFLIPLL